MKEINEAYGIIMEYIEDYKYPFSAKKISADNPEERLKKQFSLPVYFSDERLTTIAARDEMHTHLKGASRFENADSVSAKIIVESWMRSR